MDDMTVEERARDIIFKVRADLDDSGRMDYIKKRVFVVDQIRQAEAGVRDNLTKAPKGGVDEFRDYIEGGGIITGWTRVVMDYARRKALEEAIAGIRRGIQYTHFGHCNDCSKHLINWCVGEIRELKENPYD